MASGVAERLFQEDPSRPVAICDCRGRVRWSDIWTGNPAIATPAYVESGQPVRRLRNASGCRPYIRYPFTATHGMRFTHWRARDYLGRIYLTDDERAIGRALRDTIGPYVMIEPDVKPTTTPNKAWGVERFASVVQALPEITFVRAHGQECPPFDGVRNIQTRTFREACGYLAASEGYVGTEGGYHHAAAALHKPAVVIFGGFISPKTTGYPGHVNLCDKGIKTPCGRWQPCDHCREAMDRITVEQMVDAVRQVFCASFMEVQACP